MLCEGAPQQTPVLGQYLLIAITERPEQARRAFDIGEKECDGPARELWHHLMVSPFLRSDEPGTPIRAPARGDDASRRGADGV